MNQTNTGAPLQLSKYKCLIPSAIESLSIQKTAKCLGPDYEPLQCDVVCGRGKGNYNRPGNKQFRSIVASFIPEYLQSKTKIDKTRILNAIIEEVRSQTDPHTDLNAQFIKHAKNEGWIEIGDDQAREKVGHAIREAIASHGAEHTGSVAKPRQSKSSIAKREQAQKQTPRGDQLKQAPDQIPSTSTEPSQSATAFETPITDPFTAEDSLQSAEVDFAIGQARFFPVMVGSRSSFTLFDDCFISV